MDGQSVRFVYSSPSISIMEFDQVLVKVHGYVPSLLNSDIKTLRHLRTAGRGLLTRHKHLKKA